MTRIKEDIRFYLPADPYYYRVDNLPLEDLLQNDIKLQGQIDDMQSAETGNTLNRSGFLELKPYIDNSLPGMVSVNAGNFIGRVQRSSGGNLTGETDFSVGNGITEIADPPTGMPAGGADGHYRVDNLLPPLPEKSVGRTSVIEYKGGSVSIDAFDATDFDWALTGETVAPAGRIDLIGLTTMNGAFDDPLLPGNSGAGIFNRGTGYAKLAVVKGAGITRQGGNYRVSVVGEKFITVGMPQSRLNPMGRDIEGNVVPNPEFGTVPSPDDIVNICFSRPDITTSLNNFANSNQAANFFLPLAYVFVPASHVQGSPIPQNYLKDIRPFFRTAELSLAERQAVMASVQPSINNPLVTVSNAEEIFEQTSIPIEQRLSDIESQLASTTIPQTFTAHQGVRISNINGWTKLKGWTKVTFADMQLAPSMVDRITHVRIFFFGFKDRPDSHLSDSATYAYVSDFAAGNPVGIKVLAGRSAGSGDSVAFSNTCDVKVTDRAFYYKIAGGTTGRGAGFNGGFYADIQGYTYRDSIM